MPQKLFSQINYSTSISFNSLSILARQRELLLGLGTWQSGLQLALGQGSQEFSLQKLCKNYPKHLVREHWRWCSLRPPNPVCFYWSLTFAKVIPCISAYPYDHTYSYPSHSLGKEHLHYTAKAWWLWLQLGMVAVSSWAVGRLGSWAAGSPSCLHLHLVPGLEAGSAILTRKASHFDTCDAMSHAVMPLRKLLERTKKKSLQHLSCWTGFKLVVLLQHINARLQRRGPTHGLLLVGFDCDLCRGPILSHPGHRWTTTYVTMFLVRYLIV